MSLMEIVENMNINHPYWDLFDVVCVLSIKGILMKLQNFCSLFDVKGFLWSFLG